MNRAWPSCLLRPAKSVSTDAARFSTVYSNWVTTRLNPRDSRRTRGDCRAYRLAWPAGAVLAGALTTTVASAGVGVWTTNGPSNGNSAVLADGLSPSVLYSGAFATYGESPVVLNKSSDNGASWNAVGDSSCLGGQVVPLATLPPSTVFISVLSPSPGPPGVSFTYLYKSLDGGATCTDLHYTVINGGLSLTLDGVNPNTMYAASDGAALGQLARSLDGGATWTRIDVGLPPASISGVAADPRTSGTVYLAMTQFLLKSVDSGTTWLSLATTAGQFGPIAVDPSNSSVIYVGGTPNLLPGAAVSVVKSTDGGATFTPASLGLPDAAVWALRINPRSPANLFASTNQGVFESLDSGSHWQSLNSGLEDHVPDSLAINSTGEYLHTGSLDGVFDYQLTSPTCAVDAHTLCLNSGRFAVSASFQVTPEGPSTQASAVPLTSDTGYFWFFDPANIEMVAKVLTGCSLNGNYWVFAGGLTDVGVELKVTDTLISGTRTYSNAVGTAFQPIQDSSAFRCP